MLKALPKSFSTLKNKSLVKLIGIYTFTNFFTKGISFLLIPLFTNPSYLTPADNGILSLFNSSVIFLVPFISIGLVQSTSTDFFKLDKSSFRDFFTTSFVLPVLLTILAIAVLFICRHLLYKKFGFPPVFTLLIPLTVLFSFCTDQLLGLIRNNNEPYYFFTVGVGKTIVELGMATLLIILFKYQWQGRVVGISVSYIAVTAFAFVYFFKKGYLGGKIKKDFIKSELVYALPIVMLQLSIFVMSSSDKFFLADNHEIVGIYGIACTFSSVILILGSGLLQYIFPKIFSLLSVPKIDYAAIRRLFYLYAVVMLLGTIAVLLFTPLFYKVFINVKYHSALKYISLIVVGYLAWTLTYFFYSFLLYHKQKTKILLLSLLSIAVSIGCNSFFITRFGDSGAALAVCCCYVLMLFITVYFTKSYWKLLLNITA